MIDITSLDSIELNIQVHNRDFELPQGIVFIDAVFIDKNEASYSGQEFWRIKKVATPSRYKYDIQGRRLKLNSYSPDKCTVSLKGSGFFLDENGLPYIVDGHQDAIYAYMMFMNAKMKLAKSGRGLNEKREFERDWEIEQQKCIVNDNTANPDLMEHIGNIWGSIIPPSTSTLHKQGFETIR